MSTKYDYDRWNRSKRLVMLANASFWASLAIMLVGGAAVSVSRWAEYRLYMALPALVAMAVQKQVRWYHWVCPACGVQLPVNKSPRTLRNCPRCQVKLCKEADTDQKTA